MNYKYKELLDIIKSKQKNKDEKINNIIKKKKITEQEVFTLFNELIDEPNKDKVENESLDNIIFCKEYIKDNITIGIVGIKREICDIFDFDEEFILQEKYKIVYDVKVMLIDEINYIDNLFLNRFKTKKDALKKAKEITNKFQNLSLDNIIDIIRSTI